MNYSASSLYSFLVKDTVAAIKTSSAFKDIHPFFLFAIILLLSLCEFVFCMLFLLILIKAASAIFVKIAFLKLKNKIKRNPDIGIKDEEGNLVFKQGGFTLKYRLAELSVNERRKKIVFISRKRRLSRYEEDVENIKRFFTNLWVYSEWVYFFRPRIFIPFLCIILFFYFAVFEPVSFKTSRSRVLISRLLKVPAKSVAVAPDGWVTISGQRLTAVDKQVEPVSYNVNPFKWLTHSDDGYVFRNIGGDYGTVNYPVNYNDRGEMKLRKDDKWISGDFNIGKIEWEKPQGSGIRAGKVLGHDEVVSQDGILLKDKEP